MKNRHDFNSVEEWDRYQDNMKSYDRLHKMLKDRGCAPEKYLKHPDDPNHLKWWHGFVPSTVPNSLEAWLHSDASTEWLCEEVDMNMLKDVMNILKEVDLNA